MKRPAKGKPMPGTADVGPVAKPTRLPPPPPKIEGVQEHRHKMDLHPFGERFRFNVKGGGHDVSLIMEPHHVRQLRDRCNEVLKEGRAVAAKRRARDKGGAKR